MYPQEHRWIETIHQSGQCLLVQVRAIGPQPNILVFGFDANDIRHLDDDNAIHRFDGGAQQRARGALRLTRPDIDRIARIARLQRIIAAVTIPGGAHRLA